MESESQRNLVLESSSKLFSDEQPTNVAGSVIPSVESEHLAEAPLPLCSEVNGKKRRQRQSPVGIDVTKKRRIHKSLFKYPNINYVRTLNEEIESATSGPKPDSHLQNTKSKTLLIEGNAQLGLTLWTAHERSQLANSLYQLRWRGSHALPSSIGSKSDAEVLEMQGRLESSANVWKLDPKPPPPAALEIGEECCDALAKEADNISYLQWKEEVAAEEDRFGRYAILVHNLVPDIKIALSLGDKSTSEYETELPNDKLVQAATLFRLNEWLDLSEKFFMFKLLNDQSEMDQMITTQFERPGIFATAFCDFYNLTVSVTKRLVSTAIFQAESRLRCANDSNLERKVTNADIYAALDLLSMDYNSKGYWRQAPSRLGLKVYRKPEKRRQVRITTDNSLNGIPITMYYSEFAEDDLMDYEEVDQTLGSFTKRYSDYADDASQNNEENENESVEVQGANGREEIDETPVDNQTDFEEEDEMLEKIDGLASEIEEKRIWELLAPPPRRTTLQSFESAGPFEEQMVDSEDPQVLVLPSFVDDWRNKVDFRAEWERYGYVLDETAFSGAKERAKWSNKVLKRRSASRKALSTAEQDSAHETEDSDGSSANSSNDVAEGSENGASEIPIDDSMDLSSNERSTDSAGSSSTGDEETSNADDESSSQSSPHRELRTNRVAPSYAYEIPDGMAPPSDSEDEYIP